jgi:hypothetical protein
MGFAPLKDFAVKIEPGVPLPGKCEGRRLRSFPWLEMKVGDSFFVPREQHGMARNAHAAGQRYGLKFATRAVTEAGKRGTRIWRLA